MDFYQPIKRRRYLADEIDENHRSFFHPIQLSVAPLCTGNGAGMVPGLVEEEKINGMSHPVFTDNDLNDKDKECYDHEFPQ